MTEFRTRWQRPGRWYNGFSPEQRGAVTPIQNAAVRSGKLIKPTICSICGFSDPTDPKGRGYIFMHLEDYRTPLNILPACKRCHAALHARFDRPGPWLRILAVNSKPDCWFAGLSMDPGSQRAPFDETYPEGIPPTIRSR